MLVAVLAILIGASAASHQLTPFAILAATTALVVLGRTQLKGLPIITAVIVGLWVSYMTVVSPGRQPPWIVADSWLPVRTRPRRSATASRAATCMSSSCSSGWR